VACPCGSAAIIGTISFRSAGAAQELAWTPAIIGRRSADGGSMRHQRTVTVTRKRQQENQK